MMFILIACRRLSCLLCPTARRLPASLTLRVSVIIGTHCRTSAFCQDIPTRSVSQVASYSTVRISKVGRHEPIPHVIPARSVSEAASKTLPRMGGCSCPTDDPPYRFRTREPARRADRVFREKYSPDPRQALL